MLSNTYQNMRIGIGEKYPDELRTALSLLKPGDIFTTDKNTYVCSFSSPKESRLCLLKTSVSLSDHTLENFKEQKPVNIFYTNDIDIQTFYDENADLFSSRIKARFTTLYTAQEWVNKVIGTLEDGNTKEIHMGDIKLAVQRIGKAVRWYDTHGNVIDEALVKRLYAWFKTAPVEHFIKSEQDQYDNHLVFREIEQQYATGDFVSALNFIKQHCTKRGFIYQEKSFVERGIGFIPKAFAFRQEKTGFKIYEIFYENGDFNRPLEKIKSISQEAFINFCREKYNNQYHLFYNESEKSLMEKFPNRTPLQDKIIKNTAIKLAGKRQKASPIIAEKEISDLDDKLDAILSIYDEEEYGLEGLDDGIHNELP